MDYEVVEARYVRDYVLWLRFRDGTSGEIDLQTELRGPIFEPLKNLDAFRQVHVSPAIGTIAWPNHADIAPEFLYGSVRRPEISRFQGIVIAMYSWRSSRSPHWIDRVWIGLVQRAADPSLFYSTLPRYLSSQATTSSTI